VLDPKSGLNLFTTQSPPMEVDESSVGETITNVFGFLRRRGLVILVLGLIGAALGAVYFLKSEPRFIATTTLLINTHKIAIMQQPASDQMPMEALGAVESQVELLRSDEVALRVIKKLDLANNPLFIPTHRGAVGRLLQRVFPNYFSDGLSESERQNLALQLVNKNLTVERSGISYAIEIKFQANEPGLAAKVANAVAEAYVDLQRSSKNDATLQTSEWLEARLPELRAKSEAARRAVVDYKQKYNIVEMVGGQLIEDERVTDLNLKLSAARDEAAKAQAKSEQFAALSGKAPLVAPAHGTDADGATSDPLGKLRSQYFDIASKLAESSGRLGANNPAIVSLRSQEAQLRTAIGEEIQRQKQASESDYAAAALREANLNKDLDAAIAQAHKAKEAQVNLQELEASAHTYQDLYATYMSNYNAFLQQAASPTTEATVITSATPLIQRDYKKAFQVAALFPLAGAMLGLGVAFLREMLADRFFLTSMSVQSRLRCACIGLLPRLHVSTRKGRRSRIPPAGGDSKAVVRGDRAISWTVIDRPFSLFSEGVRSIKFAIELESRSGSGRVIGFTSALAHEGKSTVALAVAQMIASNGASTLLVDCDLRNPSLSRSIAPGASSGIVDLALGTVSLANAVWKDSSTGMAFLPAVLTSAPPDPTSILSSVQMRRAFDELRQQYQFIIVDLSPLVPVIDVYATTDFVDAFVLVIEWGRTKVDIVKRALRSVPPVSNSMIGAVLNKTDFKGLAAYDPYISSYHFDVSDVRVVNQVR
jgi:succinoglycan biosynthesis transport protein ExoP